MVQVNVEKTQGPADTTERMRTYVIKQVEQNDVLATSNKLPDDDFAGKDLNNKIIAPPYDPYQLSILVETSSVLGGCINTMEVNVDSFGFELKSAVDDETYAELMNNPETKKVVDKEWQDVINFFKYCNRKLSYTQLRKRLRRDFELTGNGYWEILRNMITGRITGIEWIASNSMRIGRLDPYYTDVTVRRKINEVTIEEMPDKQRFRRFLQIKEKKGKPMWFKEFGDPRIMDAETGARAAVTRSPEGKVTLITPVVEPEFEFDVKKFEAGKMILATEILHFANYQAGRTLPYGSPRWIGTLLSIMGSRASEEVNYLYFENKTVPPGMILVSGGKLSNESVNRITNHIKENVKGKGNYHSIMVIEADNGPQNPQLPNKTQAPRIQWVPMTDQQQTDALFQNYDQNNIDKVIGSFRFWSGYVSRTKEINVATAEVARQISEEQVFQPEREDFDSVINRTILIEMGINYWEHKSKGPQLASPKAIAEILTLVKPFLTGEEGREICKTIFGKEFTALKADWLQKPMELVIAELGKAKEALAAVGTLDSGSKTPKEADPEAVEKSAAGADILKNLGQLPTTDKAVVEFVANLVAVRKALDEAEAPLSDKAMRGDDE